MPVIPLPNPNPPTPPVPPVPPFPPGTDQWCGWDIDPTELCPDWETYTPAQQDIALNTAVTIMWAATGRRYGPCEVTIRPCQSQWWAEQYRVFPVWWTGSGYSGPYPFLYGGQWFNACGCGPGCCCKASCEVLLPGPVASVSKVLVGGVAVTTYRVDIAEGAYHLVKTSPGCWPTCQNFDQPGTGADAFEITYTRGIAVSSAVVGATMLLSCEIAKGLAGADCALPQRMQSLTRQGVTAEFIVNELDINTFQTGIQAVDMVIRAENPSRRTRPPVVLSPDMPGGRDRITIIGG
jgi:hypothetical protein